MVSLQWSKKKAEAMLLDARKNFMLPSEAAKKERDQPHSCSSRFEISRETHEQIDG